MFETQKFPKRKTEYPKRKPELPRQKDISSYSEEKLNMLADEIMDRLRLENRIIALEKEKQMPTLEDKSRSDTFLKISTQVFRENGIKENLWHTLKSQIGKILNDRKPKIPITKLERKRMISGAEKLKKENLKRGIDEHGDPLEDF
ncbi:MAG: hypothetical protein V1804_03050 [Patescibacteria group bacterium]